MLNLQSKTPVSWVRLVEEHLDEVLVDHAHCEKKAAGVGMNLVFSYVEDTELVERVSEVVAEELEHLRAVVVLLRDRSIPLRRQEPSSYGRRLGELVRRKEPERLVDRCLIAALIEARSCERFQLLAEHLSDRELAAFYAGLMESEARHHGLYVRLAQRLQPAEHVRTRLEELSAREAEIIARGDPFVRLHS